MRHRVCTVDQGVKVKIKRLMMGKCKKGGQGVLGQAFCLVIMSKVRIGILMGYMAVG